MFSSKNNPPNYPDPISDEWGGASKKELLLLVEDDKVNQMLGRKMLAKAGYDVEVEKVGKKELEYITSHNKPQLDYS